MVFNHDCPPTKKKLITVPSAKTGNACHGLSLLLAPQVSVLASLNAGVLLAPASFYRNCDQNECDRNSAQDAYVGIWSLPTLEKLLKF